MCYDKKSGLIERWKKKLPFQKKKSKKKILAESGFDPPTCELWARHASPAPLRFVVNFTFYV